MAETWPALQTIVAAFHVAEGADINDPLYRALANRGLGELSARIGHFETTWNNDGATGSPTISTRYVTFPDNLVDLESAYWNNVQMTEITSPGEFDRYDPLWRTATGVPYAFIRTARGMTLNREPSSSSGLLDIFGLESIPLFSDVSGSTNPLTYLLAPHQLIVADYMVWNLPIDLRDKNQAQIATMQGARESAERRWITSSEACIADMMRRKLQALTGD